MRAWLGSGAALTALVVSLALAGAQQAPDAPGQQQKAEKAQQSEAGRAGAEEPSSRSPLAKPQETAPFVNGRLTAPGAPTDGQTVPAKFSERNDRLDALPMMAFPLKLSDDQKHRIRAAVGKTPVADTRVMPADRLPSTVELRPLPEQLREDMPFVANLGFVRTKDDILLVKALDRTVVERIVDQKAVN
jgi:hypothetical protein